MTASISPKESDPRSMLYRPAPGWSSPPSCQMSQKPYLTKRKTVNSGKNNSNWHEAAQWLTRGICVSMATGLIQTSTEVEIAL